MTGSSDARPTAAAGAAGLRKFFEGVKVAQAARIWPEIANPTDAEREAMRYGVDCEGVTVHDLGAGFGAEFQRLKGWCREHCTEAFAVEPTRDPVTRQYTGRRFRFSRMEDAALFRLSCL